jgi:hypothetical protein
MKLLNSQEIQLVRKRVTHAASIVLYKWRIQHGSSI